MAERQINEMLTKSMQNINMIVDSSKVIGKPIPIDDHRLMIPLSRISFGFGVGGSEFKADKDKVIVNQLIDEEYPFGGGSLGGVYMTPIAFILLDQNSCTLHRINENEPLYEKLLSLMIEVLKKSKKKTKN